MNHPIMFLDQDNKRKLVPASLAKKCVMVITAIISLHYKQTNYTVFFYFALIKK